MSDSVIFDAIIVGGGPAGSACATILGRAGLKILLCEKERFPREKICGDSINPKVWRLLELLGLDAKVRAEDLSIIDRIRVTNRKGISLSVPVKTHRQNPFFAIKRHVFDTLLLQHAKDCNVCVWERTRVLDIYRRDKWSVDVKRLDSGMTETVTADFIIGADGRNSFVAKKLSADTSKKSNHRRPRVGVQWHTGYQAGLASRLELFLMDSGYFGLVNVDQNHANIAMVTTPELAQLAHADFALFADTTLLKNSSFRESFSQIKPVGMILTSFPINPVTRHIRSKNAFLIGDARQTVEPFTGEGVYFALKDGINLARRLLQLFNYEADFTFPQSHTCFGVNRVFSPILQKHGLADRSVWIGSRIPPLVTLTMRAVL